MKNRLNLMITNIYSLKEVFYKIRQEAPLLAYASEENKELKFQPTNRDPRIMIWKHSIDMISDKPVIGHGFGEYKNLTPQYFEPSEPVFDHAHSVILTLLVETGIPGLAAFLLLWSSYIITMIRNYKNRESNINKSISLWGIAGSTVFLLAGFTEYNFGDSEVLLMILFMMAVTMKADTFQTVKL